MESLSAQGDSGQQTREDVPQDDAGFESLLASLDNLSESEAAEMLDEGTASDGSV